MLAGIQIPKDASVIPYEGYMDCVGWMRVPHSRNCHREIKWKLNESAIVVYWSSIPVCPTATVEFTACYIYPAIIPGYVDFIARRPEIVDMVHKPILIHLTYSSEGFRAETLNPRIVLSLFVVRYSLKHRVIPNILVLG